MFKITATRPINWTWCSFALVKGDNEFTSRAAVPAELWTKLERLRGLGLVSYDDLAEGEKDGVKLEELKERHLYAMSKDELAELAKANGLSVKASDESVGVKKKDLLDALVAKLPKPTPAEQPATEAAPAAAKGKAKKPDPAPSGTITVE